MSAPSQPELPIEDHPTVTDHTPEVPATNPCRATYETPTARTIRQATEEAESAKACERETFADLAAERAAHDAHRTAVSEALGLGTGAPWGAITDRAREVAADMIDRRAGAL
jgi:hypothetical protein